VTAALLREAGEAMYGHQWRSNLARDLSVTERTIRRWASGEWDVPRNALAELRALLKARGLAMAAVRRKLPR
jgi:hypothetical protein